MKTKAEGRKGQPTPAARWLREPSPERVVRAALLLLGKTGAEVERAMSEGAARRKPAA